MAPAAIPVDASLPKDDTELELEKLVFGDQQGFRQQLRLFEDSSGDEPRPRSQRFEPKLQLDNAGEERDLATVDDSELFFFDSKPDAAAQTQLVALHSEDSEDDREEYDAPAWVDSDDEQVAVSLASNSRLRKLRRTENEDIINGIEYTRRLRQQYRHLYPEPEWAIKLRSQKGHTHRHKRRRTSATSNSSGGESTSDEQSDSEDIAVQPLAQLLQSTRPLVQGAATKQNGRILFRPEVLDIQRAKDISGSHPSAILSLSFHPSLPLLLSSGPSGLLSLHHVAPTAPTPNPILTRVAIRGLPIQRSQFHPSGSQAVLTAQRRYYHVWNLESGRFTRVTSLTNQADSQRNCDQFSLSPCGRFIALIGSGKRGGGSVNIVDASTGQLVCTARVEGRGGAADLAWWRSGDGLCILGKGGEILEYSVLERRPLARWNDDGAVDATVIALGGVVKASKQKPGLGGDRFVAIGSSAGIVNIYDRSSWAKLTTTDSGDLLNGGIPEKPVPLRTCEQLVTPITQLDFSPDGQLLAMSSKWKRDALRLVHLPSCTVYKNWPTSNTPLGRVTCSAWGQLGEEGTLALVVANEQGKIRMWEVLG